jgi:cell division protein FtsW
MKDQSIKVLPIEDKPHSIDFWFLLCVLILCAVGLIMVFSASAYSLNSQGDSVYSLITKQGAMMALGFGGMFVASNIRYTFFQKYYRLFLWISIGLLVFVLIPGVGLTVGGATRWIPIGPFTIQPSEVAKIGLVVYLSGSIAKLRKGIKDIFILANPYLIVFAMVATLIYLQPDLSTILVIFITYFGVILVSGTPFRFIMLIGGSGIAAVTAAVLATPWRLERLLAAIGGESAENYQIINATMALGSGGLFGKGLGNGYQKLNYLPEVENDFIFTNVGEEFGLIGTLVILLLFAFLLWRGFRIAMYAPNRFSQLYVSGIMIMIGSHVCVHTAVSTGLIPVTGMTLPFISAGGSSLIFLLSAVGIIINISKYTKTKT